MKEINYCEKCGHTGYIRIDDNTVSCCECYKSTNALKTLYNQGLGYILERYTFDRYTTNTEMTKHLYKKAQDYLNEKKKWFTILAPSGYGKTFLCISIINELIKKNKECYVIRWVEFVSQLNAYVNTEQYFDLMDKVKNYEVLYIDDFLKPLSSQNPTTADLKKAYEIIDYRLINNKQTIISSERSFDELISLDEATAGRIYQMSQNYLINLKKKEGGNLRLKNN